MSKQPPDAVVKEFSLLPKVTNTTMAQWLNVSQVINGGIAGIVGVSIIFPLDLVKVFGVLSCLKKWFGYFDICTLVQVRLQNQKIGGGTKIYTGMADCFRKIYKSEVGEKKGKLHNFSSRDSLACTEVAQSICYSSHQRRQDTYVRTEKFEFKMVKL